MFFSSRKLSVGWVAVICGIVGFAVYINSLDCRFCFDDLSAITENQDLRFAKI